MSINITDIHDIDLSYETTGEQLPLVSPGQILKEEFLEPIEITAYRLAKDINVPPGRIGEIIHGHRSISADTALRLSRYFGTTAEFWMNLQGQYDIRKASAELGDSLDEVKHHAA